MSILSMDEILDGLSDVVDDLDEIPRYAFEKYRRYDPAVLLEHDARAAASCTYSHMVAEADRRWLGRRGFVPHEMNGLKVWLIRDQAVIRWKKMDEDGRSRNYPTRQALGYDRGDPLPGLPEPAVRLSAGYLLDVTQTEFVRAQVARPLGKGILWCAAIIPAEEAGESGKRWEDVTRQHGLS